MRGKKSGQKLLAVLLALSMCFSTAAFATEQAGESGQTEEAGQAREIEPVGEAGANMLRVTREISGSISESQTWNDGDTIIGEVAIQADRPIVITVNGIVTVKAGLRIAEGSAVVFDGGGTLKRDADNFSSGHLITVRGDLTLNRVTLDGGSTAVSGSLVYVRGSGRLTMNKDAVLQNNTYSNDESTDSVNFPAGGAVKLLGDSDTAKATFTMNGGTIQNCRAHFGGAVGLMNDCTFEMNGGLIQSNQAVMDDKKGDGGGVYVINESTFRMNGGTISNNRACSSGGGVMVVKTKRDEPGGTFLMGGNSKISGNQALYGGGVANTSSFTMSGRAEISGENYAAQWGGGLSNAGQGVFTMEDGTISGNKTGGTGGGIFNTNATVDGPLGKVTFYGEITFNSGSITGNDANAGGGIANNSKCTFTMNGGEITENTAETTGGGIFSYGHFTRTAGTLYNNTAEDTGDDFYGSDHAKNRYGAWTESGSISLGTVGGDWTLASSGEKHVIDGWYKDDAENRWECDRTTDLRTDWSSSDAYFGVKAAHGAATVAVKLTVSEDTPETKVQGLTEAAERMKETNKHVTVEMTVTAEDELAAAGGRDIRARAGRDMRLDFLDIAIHKTVKETVSENGASTTQITKSDIHETETIQIIEVSFDFTGKTSIKVFRHHDGAVQELVNDGTKTEGTYQLDQPNSRIIICAKKFSTYAIASSEAVLAPPPPSDGGGGGGGSSGSGGGGGGGGSPVAPAPAPEGKPGTADPTVTGVASLLNTRDHINYLNGFTDGSFRPGAHMTRGQAAQMFYNLLLDRSEADGMAFSDVPAGMWCEEAVRKLSALEIAVGYSDGTFRPDQPITRAQFVVIAMRFTKAATAGIAPPDFTDLTPDSFGYDAIAGAVAYGWISGYSDGTFRPRATITRAQAAKIVNNMLSRSADTAYIDAHSDTLRHFPDADEKKYWAYYEIMEAANPHRFRRDGGGEAWTG